MTKCNLSQHILAKTDSLLLQTLCEPSLHQYFTDSLSAYSLPCCQLLYSSIFEASSSIHVTVCCEWSWPGVSRQRLGLTVGQGRATLQSIQEEGWGVGWCVEERGSGVCRVKGWGEKRKAGSPQRGGALHGTGGILHQTLLRWKLLLACIPHSAFT